jgi:hypothetical protein
MMAIHLVRVYNLYKKHGRDPIVKDFKGLRHLRPGLAGAVIDEHANIKEVVATIIDLTYRGYLKIKKKHGEIFLKRQMIGGRLLDYEKKIMEHLFAEKEEIKLSTLAYFPYYMHAVLINKEAFKQGLLAEDSFSVFMRYVRDFFSIPTLLSFSSFFFMLFSVFFIRYALVIPFISIIIFLISLVNLFVVGRLLAKMPKKTEKGVAHANMYIEMKKWMQKYPLEEGRLSDEYLPYAIAFGIQNKWIAKLSRLWVAKDMEKLGPEARKRRESEMKEFAVEFLKLVPESMKRFMEERQGR